MFLPHRTCAPMLQGPLQAAMRRAAASPSSLCGNSWRTPKLRWSQRQCRDYMSAREGVKHSKQARKLARRAEELIEEARACAARLEQASHEDSEDSMAAHKSVMSVVSDCSGILELIGEAGDEELPLLAQEVQQLEDTAKDAHLASLMCRSGADADAFLTLNAGAGGHDSADWCQMLLRMYSMWAGKAGLEVEEVDVSEGEHGIKSATVKICGRYAFGWLELETGVHRLVRISPFDSKERRHTSFAVVQVMPDLGDEGPNTISAGDLRIETKRASGAGGQHVNTTDSAVRITHIPTGIVAQANSRSQHRNRALAMSMIAARVRQQVVDVREKERSEARQSMAGKSWGEQIRNYVLHPNQTVVDLRSRFTTNPMPLLDGNLEPMLVANLEHHLDQAEKE